MADGLYRERRAIVADGLYRVTTRYLCAGFVMQGGRITMCAPILRKRLPYWQTVAVLVSGSNEEGSGNER